MGHEAYFEIFEVVRKCSASTKIISYLKYMYKDSVTTLFFFIELLFS